MYILRCIDLLLKYTEHMQMFPLEKNHFVEIYHSKFKTLKPNVCFTRKIGSLG